MNTQEFDRELRGLGLNLTPSQMEAFERFEAALYEANERSNLTRVRREECWVRHFLDSVLFHDLFEVGWSVVDLGTGPGFPAWPLAAGRRDLLVTALDSNGKMLAFLRSQGLPNLTVVNARAEEWRSRQSFDAVTGRAIAPLSIQLELSARPCRVGGLVLPLRTSADRQEAERLAVNPLGLQLEEMVERTLPVQGAERLCPIFRKVARTPSTYPRRWAEMKAKPI